MKVWAKREVNNGRRELRVIDLSSIRGVFIEDSYRFNRLIYKASISDPPDNATLETLRERNYIQYEVPEAEFDALYNSVKRSGVAGYEELSRQEAPAIMALFFASNDLEGLIEGQSL